MSEVLSPADIEEVKRDTALEVEAEKAAKEDLLELAPEGQAMVDGVEDEGYESAIQDEDVYEVDRGLFKGADTAIASASVESELQSEVPLPTPVDSLDDLSLEKITIPPVESENEIMDGSGDSTPPDLIFKSDEDPIDEGFVEGEVTPDGSKDEIETDSQIEEDLTRAIVVGDREVDSTEEKAKIAKWERKIDKQEMRADREAGKLVDVGDVDEVSNDELDDNVLPSPEDLTPPVSSIPTPLPSVPSSQGNDQFRSEETDRQVLNNSGAKRVIAKLLFPDGQMDAEDIPALPADQILEAVGSAVKDGRIGEIMKVRNESGAFEVDDEYKSVNDQYLAMVIDASCKAALDASDENKSNPPNSDEISQLIRRKIEEGNYSGEAAQVV